MKRKILVFLVAAAVLVGLAFAAKHQLSLEQLAGQEQQLRQSIADHPWRSLFAGLGIYFAVSLVPGTSGKSIVCGWLFGLWCGVLIVDLALTAAALATFALSRFIFRELVESRLSHFLIRFNRAIQREGAFYLLTLRMLHVPFTLVNYGAGASCVQAYTFGWTTLLGLLPSTILFVFVGTKLPTLRELADHGAEGLLDPWILISLIMMGCFPWTVRFVFRQIRRKLVRDGAC